MFYYFRGCRGVRGRLGCGANALPEFCMFSYAWPSISESMWLPRIECPDRLLRCSRSTVRLD
jgi:hypothetical protein